MNPVAGDTFTLSVQTSRSPGEGFAHTLYLVGPTFLESTDAEYKNGGVTMLVKATKSETLQGGIYSYEIVAEKGTGEDLERYTEASGEIEVAPRLTESAGTKGPDTLAKYLSFVEAIDAALLGKATEDQLKIVIGQDSVERIPLPHLLRMRDYYLAEIAALRRALRIRNGGKPFGTILTRFTRT